MNSLEADFSAYYRREMRIAAVALFLFVGGNFAAAPLYRAWLLSTPKQVPLAIWVLEEGLVVGLSLLGALVHWRWPQDLRLRWLTYFCVAGISAGIVGTRYLWVTIGVPFFNELIGYFLIAAMVMTGCTFRPLLRIALLAFIADIVASYKLYGWGRIANFEVLSDITAGFIAAFSGWFTEKNMRRIWAETNALERLARQDALTGLLNRRGFETHAQETLRQAAQERKELSIALLDLDHFKPFNDRHGHPAGDEVLRVVARTLAEHARQPLDLVARYGGEEFVILWYDTGSERLTRRCDELVEAIRKLQLAVAVPLTASIGAVSGSSYQEPRVEQWIEKADQLLYRAKQEGRDRALVSRF